MYIDRLLTDYIVSRLFDVESLIFYLQVSPQSHNGDIIYENSDGIVIRYNKHHQQDLELPVQEKLRQLPMVIKYLIEPMHKSIR